MLTLIAITSLLACKNDSKKEIADIQKVPALNLDNMDTSVKPGDDFYRYVNGKWLDTNKIPDEYSFWGSAYEVFKKTNDDALAILKSAMSDNKDLEKIEVMPGSDQEKAVNLFQTIMDTVSRNKQGVDPLKPYLAKINAIKDINDLQTFLIEMEPTGGAGFFGFGVSSHPKNSNMNAGYLGGGQLGLSRDYYVDQDDDTKEKREKYKQHIVRMLQYIGDSEEEAKVNAETVLTFETRMAEPRMTKEDRRDARKRYNPKSMSDLSKLVPEINWNNYFKGIGVKQLDTVIVSDPGYFKALNTILSENNLNDWKQYLRWSLIDRSAGLLSTEIDQANWEFYSRDLRGAKKQRPREERALSTLNGTIGEALGKLYVDKKFPPEAKAKAKQMIHNVILAYEHRINALDWMSEETKKKAIEKLQATSIKIAYPDQWKDYSKLEIKSVEDGGTYLQNMYNARKWNFNKDLADLGNPVDKTQWFMAPQVVNAYYNPSFNEIVFPAAILQPPFYNYNADDAVNYGAIGAIIGHEISHSFDDSGARFDKDGNLNNWWTDDDLKQFEALGAKLADQYDQIEVLPETNINGKFTLGENIGDLGGINAAYDALQLSFEQNSRPEDIDGFTAEQRFFLSYATVWRTLSRDEALKNQIKTDPHSPNMYRALQPLKNVDAFYKAFNIKETDSMYLEPSKRVKIW
ncbi:M13 family metallopeptidase [Yeosuana marina]|uniref:M13 family metallopeptidase n=1 Tax=Yeosuana marina TaxID=1565536 RepID=UPI001F10F2B3|nr:M13 family metallopeptidase [Yeosuana marina]